MISYDYDVLTEIRTSSRVSRFVSGDDIILHDPCASLRGQRDFKRVIADA